MALTGACTHALKKAQVAKFLLEFSQRSQTKHKTALTQKGEGGEEEEEAERREGSYFLWFFEAVPHVLLTGGRGDEACIVFTC